MKPFTTEEDDLLRSGYRAAHKTDYMMVRWFQTHGMQRTAKEIHQRLEDLDYFKAEDDRYQASVEKNKRDADAALMEQIAAARREMATAPPFRMRDSETDRFLKS